MVQAFRQTVFPDNKWVATGISKGGISTTLYAFYSTQYGWNDIDLYVPFCAPFLTGSPASCADTSVHEYTVNSCGSGYPAGSTEAVAYQRHHGLHPSGHRLQGGGLTAAGPLSREESL